MHRLVDKNDNTSGFVLKNANENTGKFNKEYREFVADRKKREASAARKGEVATAVDEVKPEVSLREQQQMVRDQITGAQLLKDKGIPQLEIQCINPNGEKPVIIQREMNGKFKPEGVKKERSLEDILAERPLKKEEREAVATLFDSMIESRIGWEDGNTGNIFLREYDDGRQLAGVMDQDRIFDFSKKLEPGQDRTFLDFKEHMEMEPYHKQNIINSMKPGTPLDSAKKFMLKSLERKRYIKYSRKNGFEPGILDLEKVHEFWPDLADHLPDGWTAGEQWKALQRGDQSLLLVPDNWFLGRPCYGERAKEWSRPFRPR